MWLCVCELWWYKVEWLILCSLGILLPGRLIDICTSKIKQKVFFKLIFGNNYILYIEKDIFCISSISYIITVEVTGHHISNQLKATIFFDVVKFVSGCWSFHQLTFNQTYIVFWSWSNLFSLLHLLPGSVDCVCDFRRFSALSNRTLNSSKLNWPSLLESNYNRNKLINFLCLHVFSTIFSYKVHFNKKFSKLTHQAQTNVIL